MSAVDRKLSVKYAFSKEKDKSNGCTYVPEMMTKEAEEIVSMWRAGARFYVCGMKKLADRIGEVGRKIEDWFKNVIAKKNGE